jgi:hypothetical protein
LGFLINRTAIVPHPIRDSSTHPFVAFLMINFPVLLAVLLWIVIDTKQGRRGIGEKNLRAKDSKKPEMLVLFYYSILASLILKGSRYS